MGGLHHAFGMNRQIKGGTSGTAVSGTNDYGNRESLCFAANVVYPLFFGLVLFHQACLITCISECPRTMRCARMRDLSKLMLLDLTHNGSSTSKKLSKVSSSLESAPQSCVEGNDESKSRGPPLSSGCVLKSYLIVRPRNQSECFQYMIITDVGWYQCAQCYRRLPTELLR